MSWKSCFLKIHKFDDIKLKWLQMRIVHRVFATNVVLKKMGIINCEQCTFCDEKDSVEHFLWQYYFTRRFWRLLENLISTNCETACNIKITENLVLFGIDSTAITDKRFDPSLFYWQSSTFIDVNLSNLYRWSLCSENNLS